MILICCLFITLFEGSEIKEIKSRIQLDLSEKLNVHLKRNQTFPPISLIVKGDRRRLISRRIAYFYSKKEIKHKNSHLITFFAGKEINAILVNEHKLQILECCKMKSHLLLF